MQLQAKIENSIIYVFCVGKWRPLRQYTIKNKIPSKRIQSEIIMSIWLNTGKTVPIETIQLKFKTCQSS